MLRKKLSFFFKEMSFVCQTMLSNLLIKFLRLFGLEVWKGSAHVIGKCWQRTWPGAVPKKEPDLVQKGASLVVPQCFARMFCKNETLATNAATPGQPCEHHHTPSNLGNYYHLGF
jgi:hypothetical protein